MTVAILAPSLIVAAATAAKTGSGAAAVISGLVTALIAAYIAELKLRDNLRLSVDKAKGDLKIMNTTIAYENKKLAAMKKALPPTVNVNDLPEVPFNVNDLPEAD